mmetsp:Transcript_28839/g.51359  ORF Transcript_28839/g.51359 Transcript_28839/m.51359 type:complete len:108 (-) Transcript_28839:2335-2658(-)
MMALPPKYVRRATIANSTGHTLNLHANFEQNEQTYSVEAGHSVEIEGSIDHGSWQAVDPLKKITVHTAANGEVLGERHFESEGGIKVHHFTISLVEGSLHWLEAHPE